MTFWTLILVSCHQGSTLAFFQLCTLQVRKRIPHPDYPTQIPESEVKDLLHATKGEVSFPWQGSKLELEYSSCRDKRSSDGKKPGTAKLESFRVSTLSLLYLTGKTVNVCMIVFSEFKYWTNFR